MEPKLTLKPLELLIYQWALHFSQSIADSGLIPLFGRDILVEGVYSVVESFACMAGTHMHQYALVQ